jgi:hypothetical protein
MHERRDTSRIRGLEPHVPRSQHVGIGGKQRAPMSHNQGSCYWAALFYDDIQTPRRPPYQRHLEIRLFLDDSLR